MALKTTELIACILTACSYASPYDVAAAQNTQNATGALSTVVPAFPHAGGGWSFGFPNVKICDILHVSMDRDSGNTVVNVKNTDNTSESFIVDLKAGDSAAVLNVLRQACDDADDKPKAIRPTKTYLINVSGTGPGVPATFGGLVGSLPAAGSANAGTPGYITEVKVKKNNRRGRSANPH